MNILRLNILIHSDVLNTRLSTLLEPLGIITSPIIKIPQTRDNVLQTFLHLHRHLKLNIDILIRMVQIYAEVLVVIKENEVEIPLHFKCVD